MTRRYIKPELEVYLYSAEKGFANSLALESNTRDRDYVLIEGSTGNSMRASEEVTEYTDRYGQYETGGWD